MWVEWTQKVFRIAKSTGIFPCMLVKIYQICLSEEVRARDEKREEEGYAHLSQTPDLLCNLFKEWGVLGACASNWETRTQWQIHLLTVPLRPMVPHGADRDVNKRRQARFRTSSNSGFPSKSNTTKHGARLRTNSTQ